MIDAFCTFVMTSVDGVVLALLTKPEQPLRNIVEQLRITALTAHTHPLELIFTLSLSQGWRQLVSWGRGWGACGNGCSVLPELRVKDKKEGGTITTGMWNRFGAGAEAFQPLPEYCLRDSANWPLGRLRIGPRIKSAARESVDKRSFNTSVARPLACVSPAALDLSSRSFQYTPKDTTTKKRRRITAPNL